MRSALLAGPSARHALRRLGAQSALSRHGRCLCSKSKEVDVYTKPESSDAVTPAEPLKNKRGEVVKTWGDSVELPAVTQKEAEEAYLDATSVTRALNPPIATAVAARDDMLKDRFNYVAENLSNNPDAQYVVMGKSKVAPVAISQASFIIAGAVVLLGAIGTVVYVRTQWQVGSAKELGDRLREKGAKRKEALERSNSASLVRSLSANAETTVKSNVDLVRRPSQQLGEHLNESFKGVVKEGRP